MKLLSPWGPRWGTWRGGGGGAFTGDFEGNVQKILEMGSLASRARWGTCGVVD